MKKEMELELQLQEAQTAYGMLFDQKAAARTTVIANAFSTFTAPEGTRLSVRESNVEFDLIMDSGYTNTLARLTVETAYNEDYSKKGYRGAYRFNSGGDEEVKFLPAMADFIKIASDKVDVICKLFVDIDTSFNPKLNEARKQRDAIQRELNFIDHARQQAKKDAIFALMKSDEGFVPLKAKPNKEYSWDKSTSLTMKFDWSIQSPALIKVVGRSASGKSVKVEVSIERYDGSMHTYDVETIRMDNLTRFIDAEVLFRDNVEAKLEEFEIKQGLLL
jgi:hypothetical protein